MLQTVEAAGPNPCPPIIVGDWHWRYIVSNAAPRLVHRAAAGSNPDERYGALEDELLERINALGIGPAGMGRRITALRVHIRQAATHIAGLPVAVNICATPHATPRAHCRRNT